MKVLSKSRFKQALECPNKLFYTSNKQYANNKSEDTFLQALAQGGFQVEELARLHYPNGIFIDAENYDYEKAAQFTADALQQTNVVIYEAAFLVDGLFVRTDILVKSGTKIRLIEVKAKSFDPSDENTFVGKKGGIGSGMKPYLFDLAFQKYVAANAFPQFTFEAFFMMADKTKKSSVNGLNQMFRIPANGDPRKDFIKKVHSLADTGDSVLSEINVDQICDDILSGKYKYNDNLGFKDAIALFSDAYQNNTYLNWPTSITSCKRCEYKTNGEGLSGFEHCFRTMYQWGDADFEKPTAMEIWNYRGSQKLFDANRLFLEQISEDDFNIVPLAGKLSAGERQWLQVQKSRDNDQTYHCETDGLRDEMAAWKFPLHFIDFETSAVALPFTAGRRPYEQVAFQFSHHCYFEDGRVEHQTEFISNAPGEFPNFIFVRALKAALGNDDGTIFRFAAHENSILNAIIDQLASSNEPDKDELITFIKTITASTQNRADVWQGERSMVDLNRVVKDYYYNPHTKGSNSIKAVLPAVLLSSEFLQQKYSQPLHEIGITSKNFPADHVWITSADITNPYKMLPPLFDGWSENELNGLISDLGDIADGGAAMTAYAKLQYVDMSDAERAQITAGLLKYCELDTLAMVMIYEHFRFDIARTGGACPRPL